MGKATSIAAAVLQQLNQKAKTSDDAAYQACKDARSVVRGYTDYASQRNADAFIGMKQKLGAINTAVEDQTKAISILLAPIQEGYSEAGGYLQGQHDNFRSSVQAAPKAQSQLTVAFLDQAAQQNMIDFAAIAAQDAGCAIPETYADQASHAILTRELDRLEAGIDLLRDALDIFQPLARGDRMVKSERQSLLGIIDFAKSLLGKLDDIAQLNLLEEKYTKRASKLCSEVREAMEKLSGALKSDTLEGLQYELATVSGTSMEAKLAATIAMEQSYRDGVEAAASDHSIATLRGLTEHTLWFESSMADQVDNFMRVLPHQQTATDVHRREEADGRIVLSYCTAE